MNFASIHVCLTRPVLLSVVKHVAPSYIRSGLDFSPILADMFRRFAVLYGFNVEDIFLLHDYI